jgi:dTDP-4-amino-4,6-dideoxygalactose transaminase
MIPHSQPIISEDEIKAVVRILQSGMLAQGTEVKNFEEKMCQFIGLSHGSAVSSGSAALFLILKALEIGPGDNVALPAYVCTAPLNCIFQAGAEPLLVDIETDGYNISIQDLMKKINRKTKAIILPHMFGQPADIDSVLTSGIPVIEDCAMSLGAAIKEKMTGSFGFASVFSFYATKVITTGEGGMVLSNSVEFIEKIKDLRSYDEKDSYKIRYNFKMTDIQAAIGQVQLKRLPQSIERRQEIAALYNREFSSLNIALPRKLDYIKTIYFRYVIRKANNALHTIKKLNKKGIAARRPIFKPLNHYLKLTNFPNTDRAFEQSISIPLYPSLNDDDIKKIIREVKDAIT